MASVAVRGSAAVRSLTLQSRSTCCRDGVATSAALPKPALRNRLVSNFNGKQVPLRPSSRPSHGPSMVVAAPPPSFTSSPEDEDPSPMSGFDYGAAPPFSLADIRNAIPKQCWEKNTWRSMSFLARDVLVVLGMAAAAYAANNWAVWPLYWLAQGTMFWALFVVGHDCGHGSFSNSKPLNDFIGHLTHSSILVPYHGWRISHRTHHQNHGHVENDESWHPVTEGTFGKLDPWARIGRLVFPAALFAFPFYLWKRSPGKEGSHYDPNCDLFTASERKDVLTSNAYLIGMLGVLATVGVTLGPAMLFKLYIVPYILNVVWLDVVTYLHHHGYEEKVPWYRGQEWSYMRGGLSTIDRDYGIFNKIHHDIGTHVVHHLFPQMPHYNLTEATEAVKPVLGKYYREPEKSKGPIPVHLVKPLVESFQNDHVVPDEGEIVYYKKAF